MSPNFYADTQHRRLRRPWLVFISCCLGALCGVTVGFFVASTCLRDEPDQAPWKVNRLICVGASPISHSQSYLVKNETQRDYFLPHYTNLILLKHEGGGMTLADSKRVQQTFIPSQRVGTIIISGPDRGEAWTVYDTNKRYSVLLQGGTP